MSDLDWIDIAASQIGNGDRVYYQGYWRTVRKVHDVNAKYLRLETHFHYFTVARSEIVSVVSAPRPQSAK